MYPDKNNYAVFIRELSIGEFDLRLMINFTGTVNKNVWFGWAAGLWLYTNSNIKKNNGNWIITYEFCFKENKIDASKGWNYIPHIDTTPVIYKKLVDKNGVERDIYASSNFDELELKEEHWQKPKFLKMEENQKCIECIYKRFCAIQHSSSCKNCTLFAPKSAKPELLNILETATVYEWITAQDKYSCNKCLCMHKKILTFKETKTLFPPLHQEENGHSCRCILRPIQWD